jgi:hypothetical protein
MNGAEEEGVDEQEGQAITAIREVLRGTLIRVSQNVENGLFSDIDSFMKLSEGNTSVTDVHFYPFDKEGDDELWEKMGKCLANLKSLERFTINFDEENLEEQTNPDYLDFRANFGTLEIVLPYLRQGLVFQAFSFNPADVVLTYSQEEVKALARAIRRHPTIKEFDTGCYFSVDTFHIILSAMATLPSLQVAKLGLRTSEGSHFVRPKALKKLMLSPSLRKVHFSEFTFCGPLCRVLEDILQQGSHSTCLCLDGCSFPTNAGDRVARALTQSTTLTTVAFSGCFPQAFYGAFAGALLVNTTLTNLGLEIPDDESQAALVAPIFLALGMNKALKNLTIYQYPSSAGPVYLAIRDGLEKNSVLEMLHIRTFSSARFSISLLSSLLAFLRVSTTLKYLKVDFDQSNPHPHVTTSCLAIVAALRENSSLEMLEIHSDNGTVAHDTYMIALESVQMNPTLKKLCLSPFLASFGNDEMKRVIALVRKNYVLTELDEGVSERDETGDLDSILMLNQAGRRYLIDDAGSIAKGVEVLIDVRDDLACLFYHLLENPILCDIEHQYELQCVPTARGGIPGRY